MKILLVDDHQMFLDGIRSVLACLPNSASEPVEIHTCCSGLEALKAVEKETEAYDLILVDISMPKLNGFGFLISLRERKISSAVAVMSASQQSADILKALELGARGFIPKTLSGEDLLKAVDDVLSGHVFIPAEHEHIRKRMFNQNPPLALASLSKRQTETLELMQSGLSNKEIAQVMNISERTVKHHVKALFEHFCVQGRLECVSEAVRQGVLNASGKL